jgi:hypothetical protein
MEGPCPVCETASPEGARYCPGCGFPTAFAAEASRALATPLLKRASSEGSAEELSMGAPSPDAAALVPPARPPQEEGIDRLAHEIRRELKLLALLGADAPDVTSQLAQAALTQASGQPAAALELMRDADHRLGSLVVDAGERRVAELESRDLHMVSLGVGTDLAAETVRIRSDFNEGRVEEAIRRLEQADQRIARIEGDWRGLLGLLRQIDTLVEGSHQLGIDLLDVERLMAEVRAAIGAAPVSVEGVDRAAQTAARALMMVNEMLPPRLREELDRHQAHLSVYPADHHQSRQARVLHAEVSRHLRAGRIPEATMRLRELRSAIRELGAIKLPEPEPASTASPPPVVVAVGGRSSAASASPTPVAPQGPGSPAAASPPPPPSPLPAPSQVPIQSSREVPPVVSPIRVADRPPSAGGDKGGPAPPQLSRIAAPPSSSTSSVTRQAFLPSSASAATPPAVIVSPVPSAIPTSARAAPSPATPAPIAPEAIDALMSRARLLAIRVRSLPPDSFAAEEAAREIRNATELLRARRLKEAEQLLSRLMVRLGGEAPRPGAR